MEETKAPVGPDKAAVLLLSLGESTAAKVMEHLGPRDVEKIGMAMSGLSGVNKDAVDTTVSDFVAEVREQTGIGMGNDEYIRTMLTEALGEDKAGGIIDRILASGSANGLNALQWMDARGIADLVRDEHPQIAAIILALLEPDQAADALALLPQTAHPDLLMRIATLDGVHPTAMQELNELVELAMRDGVGASQATMGGVKAAADILNRVDGTLSAAITEGITEADADLSEQIQELTLTFEDLTDADDRSIQTLLRDISTDTLVLALKGCDDAQKEKIFKNMSQRAADMLRDDLEAKGPVKLSEVEGAQKEILTVARRLAEEGQISLGATGGGEEML
ncbi:MAG: flagellar motor switch protein FliG [Pseudomonadota bacterium]